MCRLLGLALALGIAAMTPAGAQPAGKVWRVGVLTGGVPRSSAPYLALERRLAELGYVEGRNLVIDFRTAESQLDRLPGLAAELVGRRPDVIVASATLGALAAKSASSTIPIVLSAVVDPLASGIVQSMARPGGNITGVSLLNVELSGKALQLMKEAVPGITRVGVVWSPLNRSHGDIMKSTEAAAAMLGLTLQPVEVRKPDDFPGRSMRSRGPGSTRFWCSPIPSASPTGRRSSTSPPAAGSPPCTRSGRWWTRAGSSATARTWAPATAPPPSTSTGSSRAPGPATCHRPGLQVRPRRQPEDREGTRPHDPRRSSYGPTT